MRSAIKYFLKYPIAADVILLLLSIIGLMSISGLSKSQFPTIASSTILIEGKMKGASSIEMERAFALKVEKQLKSVQGIKKTSSKSQDASSVVTVDATSKADMSKVLQDVQNAVGKINSFPTDLEEPIIYIREKKDVAAEFVIYGDANLRSLKYYAQKAETDLLDFEGIASVTLSGFPETEFSIDIREADLNKYHLTLKEVSNAIANTNSDLTAGNLTLDNVVVTIRAKGKKFSPDDLAKISIKSTPNGGIIRLSDIADVSEKWADNPNRLYFNDKTAVRVTASTTADEDISEASEYVKNYLLEFNKKYPELKTEMVTDGSILIGQRIDLLVYNGLMGMGLILIFLGLFLNIRLAFWVALSIPVCILGMFILAPMFGVNINIFSLFGLILVIGILVDDGVVIAENIYQKFEEGMPASKAAIEAVMEVLPSIFVALTTTCIFFCVFFFLEGSIGDFVSQIGFVVISTLLISLIEAFFILPAHIAHSKALKKGNKPNKLQAVFDKGIKNFRDKLFDPFLHFCLNNKFLTFSVPIVIMMICVALLMGGQAKMTFFPYIDTDVVTISVNMPVGTTEGETKKILDRIEKAAHLVNDDFSANREDGKETILSYVKKIGPKTNEGTLSLNLLDGETRNLKSTSIGNAVREKTGPVHSAESVLFTNPSLFGDAINITLTGDDIIEIRAATHLLVDALKANPDLRDINSSDQQTDNDLTVVLKPKALALDFTLREITQQLRDGYLGVEAQSLQIGQDEVKVYVRYAEVETKSLGKLENIKIKKGNNEYPLKELAWLEKSTATLAINHLNGKTKIEVKAELANVAGSVSEILGKIQKEAIPGIQQKYPGITFVYGGQSETSAETGNSAAATFPIIFLLAFFMIVLNFRSFKQATAVLILIPIAFIGIVFGHMIHGEPISVLSFYGIIAVVGVVINDSLILVSRMNQFLQKGMPFNEAVHQAGVSRFRAIILTSLTTIAGLAPLILEQSMQAKFLVPMAISMAYGLGVATFSTLILLPTLLKVMNGSSRWLYWLWEGEKKEAEYFEPAIQEQISIKRLEE